MKTRYKNLIFLVLKIQVWSIFYHLKYSKIISVQTIFLCSWTNELFFWRCRTSIFNQSPYKLAVMCRWELYAPYKFQMSINRICVGSLEWSKFSKMQFQFTKIYFCFRNICWQPLVVVLLCLTLCPTLYSVGRWKLTTPRSPSWPLSVMGNGLIVLIIFSRSIK